MNPIHDTRSVRAKTLDAASRLLAAVGEERLHLKAIAEEAGIGIASMYHYFRNKEALLASLALQGFEELRRAMLKAREDDTPTPVAAVSRAFFDYAERNPSLFALMHDQRRMARCEALREAEQRTLAVLQAAVHDDSRFPPELHASVAYALWALARGIAAVTSSQPEGKLAPELSEQLWDGVRFLVGRSA